MVSNSSRSPVPARAEVKTTGAWVRNGSRSRRDADDLRSPVRGPDQVPLVDHEDDGAARSLGVPRDPGVLRGDPFGRVEDHESQVRALQAPAGHDRGELVERPLGAPLAAKTRRVDEDVGPPLDRHQRVHGVARRAGLGVDHHPILPGDRVHQRGLPDVRAADDRDPDRAGLLGRAARRRREPHRQRLDQLGHAPPVLGRDQQHRLHPQTVDLGRRRLVPLRVNLVDGHQHGLGHAPEQPRHLLVERRQALAPVHHEDQGVGLGDGRQHLLPHLRGEGLLRAWGRGRRCRSPWPASRRTRRCRGSGRASPRGCRGRSPCGCRSGG